MAAETESLLLLMCLQAMAVAVVAVVAAIGGPRAAVVVSAAVIALCLLGWSLHRTGRRTTPSTDDASGS